MARSEALLSEGFRIRGERGSVTEPEGPGRGGCRPGAGLVSGQRPTSPSDLTAEPGLLEGRGGVGGASPLISPPPAFLSQRPGRGLLMDGYVIRPEWSGGTQWPVKSPFPHPLLPSLPGVCFTN